MKLWKVAAVLAVVAMFSVSANAQDSCATAVPAPGPVDPCGNATPGGPLGANCDDGACIGGGGSQDAWLTFVATATTAQVRTDIDSAGTDSDFIVYSGTCGSLREVGCSEDDCFNGVDLTPLPFCDGNSAGPWLGNTCVTGLVIGQTYYIQAGTFGDYCPNGPYTYTVVQPCPTADVCGDGIVNGSEECDGTAGAASCATGVCAGDCQCEPAACGNNAVECSETCDGTDDSACRGLCLTDCTCPAPVCGNNVAEAGEQCDGTDPGSCPTGACGTACACPAPVCGNGVQEAGEQCDLGAANGAVGCIIPDCACTGDCKVASDIVPAVSEWGLVVMVLIGLAAGTVMFGRKRTATA